MASQHAPSRYLDGTLGAFAFAPQSETLNHLIRYLSTWSGSDKLFMIIQYALKLIIPFLRFRARMQHRVGLRDVPISRSATAFGNFAGLISDSRMLWRLWGLLPIYQWMTSLERSPPPTRRLLLIERLQGWSMLAYYPLEHLYYLVSHSLLPKSQGKGWKARLLDANFLGLWSTRFWALYVLLQFAHLAEDRRLLLQRQKAVNKAKGKKKSPAEENDELRDVTSRWDQLYNELIVNLGYLPLTIHWSLEGGLFRNEIWEGIFGMAAGLASFRSGWQATALPQPSAQTGEDLPEKTVPRTAELEDINMPVRD